MASWRTIRVRSDLHWQLERLAREESRSVAGQLDFMLGRALDQEPNTSASSGGGSTSSESIPGEHGRGAGVDLPGDPAADARTVSRADPASAPDRAPIPVDPQRTGLYKDAATFTLPGQITVDEAITRCPVCNDSLDEERRCVDPDCASHRVTP